MKDPGGAYRFHDRAAHLIAVIDASLDRGEIDEAGWHARVADILRPAYLAGPTPEAQSGFSGDAWGWEHARGAIADAIDRDGTFLDVGCANGLLMETLTGWCAARGVTIEPYGLDFVPELAALARSRFPRWSERIFVGNALTWQPPMRFDYVRAGLEYVPPRRRRDLVEHLLRDVVATGGRLVIGVYGEDREQVPTLQGVIESWGYRIAGRSEREHRKRANEVQRVFWVDQPARTIRI